MEEMKQKAMKQWAVGTEFTLNTAKIRIVLDSFPKSLHQNYFTGKECTVGE